MCGWAQRGMVKHFGCFGIECAIVTCVKGYKPTPLNHIQWYKPMLSQLKKKTFCEISPS